MTDEKELENILESALQELERGTALPEVMARFPERREELAGLLHAKSRIEILKQAVSPDPEFLRAVLQKTGGRARKTKFDFLRPVFTRMITPLGALAAFAIAFAITASQHPASPAENPSENASILSIQEKSGALDFSAAELAAEAEAVKFGEDFEMFFAAEENLAIVEAALKF